MKMLSQEEIDKIFKVIKEKSIPSVLEIKPSEIEELEQYDRLEYKIQFLKSKRIYVKPLENLVTNLLNMANRIKYSYNVDELSIMERVIFYNSILIRSGYTQEQITNLLPKTKEEVDILSLAFENGFNDNDIRDNNTRVTEARSFLHNLGIEYIVRKTIK